jgi:ATP-dependent helicase/nuclease subunit A
VNAPEPFASVVDLQRQASDPFVSAWVSANAGSGKTYVLAQRVIRLLLEGTDPSKILCLTFTRAAAANMANRVFDTLAAWTAYDDAKLDEAMRKIGIRTVTPARRARARKLFAQALEAPGGLKVQTIHAFCTRLLQQFPFEANVAARFAVLDQRATDELLNDATLRVLTAAAAAPDTAAGQALATATADTADSTFRQVIGEAIKQRNTLLAWIAAAGGIEGVAQDLSYALEISPDDNLTVLENDLINGPHVPLSRWTTLAEICRSGSANDQDQAERLLSAAAASGADRFGAYFSVFFKSDGHGDPRARLIAGPLARRHPDVAAALDLESQRVLELRRRYNAINCRDRTVALLTLATEIVERYRAEKERRGLLDYDDLIDKTLYLLDHVEAAWVHYKLDLGMDHVLIDEAQDTSRKQWDIVTRLVAEFTAGAGARGELKRTIFAVGDDKQSIFSFQGAVPEVFALQGGEFRRRHEASELPFLPVELKHSFRSLQIILDAVDEVFKQPAVYQGLSADNTATAHTAVRAQAPGHVEIWPLEMPEQRPDMEAWDAPFDKTTEANPRARLAAKIAKAVKVWIGRDTIGDGDKRHPVRAGDILILVRQRGALFEAIIRALKNLDVAVAGADRLVLTEHIAVMDLMALGDALLLPEDELALATVLKSPLIGLGDDDLFALVWQRKGSLRAALREHAGDAQRYAEAAATLDRLADRAKRESPFAFYARVLGPERGRKRLLARLGAEAADALDEFLELALDYERRETPSLQGFLDWLRSANTEIKRDMEMVRDEVRVMTVHGAKGLEAPIVVLADTTTEPAGPPQRAPRLLPLPAERAAPGTPDRLLWIGYKADDTTVVANVRTAAQTAAEHEYRRLLYVGMTRAADRLVICGTAGEKGIPPGCWYELIEAAVKPRCVEVPADHGDGNVLRWARGEAELLPPTAASAQDIRARAPEWLNRPAPAEPRRRVIKPSDDEETARRSFAGSAVARRTALLRGSLAHRLLQSLPDIESAQRAEAAGSYLARAGKDLAAAERDVLAAEVLRLIVAEPFVPLFAPGSRAEVPIVGRLLADDGQMIAVSGQVDRLAVTEDSVLIADYKTNRPPPRRVEDVPPSYIRQLALYRALLAKIYGGRQIRAALVFTDVPDLMELSAEILDAALAKVLARVKVQ